MKLIGNKLIATKGGQLMRKADGILFGGSISLGYVYQLNGRVLDTPHLETANDYFEVKCLEFNDKNVYLAIDSTLDEAVDTLIRLRYSTSQELSILRQQDRKAEAFAAYDEYCELCKKVAKEFLISV